MAHHLTARPTEHLAAAHLREHRLHPHAEQEPVEPGGEIRSGDEEGASWPEHPPGLVHRPVRVDQVLDDLAQHHDVEAAISKGEVDAVQQRLHHGQAVGVGRGQRPCRPVDAHDPALAQPLGDEQRVLTCTAPHVEEFQRPVGSECGVQQVDPGPDVLGPGSPGKLLVIEDLPEAHGQRRRVT